MALLSLIFGLMGKNRVIYCGCNVGHNPLALVQVRARGQVLVVLVVLVLVRARGQVRDVPLYPLFWYEC